MEAKMFAGFFIHNLHNTIMQSVLGGSLHKNSTRYLLLGPYHASVNKMYIVLIQIAPQDERCYGISASSDLLVYDRNIFGSSSFSAIFENLQKMFGNVRLASDKFWKSAEIFGKSPQTL